MAHGIFCPFSRKSSRKAAMTEPINYSVNADAVPENYHSSSAGR
jgi:hypothetical protein